MPIDLLDGAGSFTGLTKATLRSNGWMHPTSQDEAIYGQFDVTQDTPPGGGAAVDVLRYQANDIDGIAQVAFLHKFFDMPRFGSNTVTLTVSGYIKADGAPNGDINLYARIVGAAACPEDKITTPNEDSALRILTPPTAAPTLALADAGLSSGLPPGTYYYHYTKFNAYTGETDSSPTSHITVPDDGSNYYVEVSNLECDTEAGSILERNIYRLYVPSVGRTVRLPGAQQHWELTKYYREDTPSRTMFLDGAISPELGDTCAIDPTEDYDGMAVAGHNKGEAFANKIYFGFHSAFTYTESMHGTWQQFSFPITVKFTSSDDPLTPHSAYAENYYSWNTEAALSRLATKLGLLLMLSAPYGVDVELVDITVETDDIAALTGIDKLSHSSWETLLGSWGSIGGGLYEFTPTTWAALSSAGWTASGATPSVVGPDNEPALSMSDHGTIKMVNLALPKTLQCPVPYDTNFCSNQSTLLVVFKAYAFTDGATCKIKNSDGTTLATHTHDQNLGWAAHYCWFDPPDGGWVFPDGNIYIEWYSDVVTFHLGLFEIYAVNKPDEVSYPEVTVGANPTSGSAPLSVDFTASVSGGTPPYSYSWNFRNGDPINTDQNPSGIIFSEGLPTGQNYTVTCTVTDDDGNICVDGATITVYQDLPPTVNILTTPDPPEGYSPFDCYFQADVGGGTGPFTYDWDWGDGSAHDTFASGWHQFTSSGGTQKTVLLTVTDTGTGLTNTATRIVRAMPVIGAHSDFTLGPLTGMVYDIKANDGQGAWFLLPTLKCSGGFFDRRVRRMRLVGDDWIGVFGTSGVETVDSEIIIGFQRLSEPLDYARLLHAELKITGDAQDLQIVFEVDGKELTAVTRTLEIPAAQYIYGTQALLDAGNEQIAFWADSDQDEWCWYDKPDAKVVRFQAPRGSRGRLTRCRFRASGSTKFTPHGIALTFVPGFMR